MALRSALRLATSSRRSSALKALRLGASSDLLAGALASSALKMGGCQARRAFMSTRSRPDDSLFAEPSFPMPAAEDPALWLEKYARPDPADMWKVGSFPLQDAELIADSVDLENDEQVLASSADLWDTAGMLSALGEGMPLRDVDAGANVDGLLRELDGYFADSVLKKRRKKMNKHKHRKRKKALRMRTKKN